jgi:hypothetical protein
MTARQQLSAALAIALLLPPATAAANDRTQRVHAKVGAFIAPRAISRAPFLPFTSPAGGTTTTIVYSSLSKYVKSPYWAWVEAAVNGPSYSGGPEIWTAAPFTPRSNGTAAKIVVAAIYDSGKNALTLSLNKDASGLPGAAIGSWQLTSLPQNLCCAVETVSLGAGIRLKARTQYWIVLSTGASETATSAGWALSELGQVHGATVAQYCSDDGGGSCKSYGLGNDVWTAIHSLYNVAFAVFGGN